jgi:hypothetical protein
LPLVWLGWLTPDGLVLWGPVSTLFAVAFALAADPMGVDGVLGGQMRLSSTVPICAAGTPGMHGVRPAATRSRSRPPLAPADMSTRPADETARVLSPVNDASPLASTVRCKGGGDAGSAPLAITGLRQP